MSNCIGFSRHWFSFYRQPGLRSPVCVRACGEPNPRPLNDQEWAALLEYRRLRGYPLDDAIETAINAHVEESEHGH